MITFRNNAQTTRGERIINSIIGRMIERCSYNGMDFEIRDTGMQSGNFRPGWKYSLSAIINGDVNLYVNINERDIPRFNAAPTPQGRKKGYKFNIQGDIKTYQDMIDAIDALFNAMM